jgi:hypothetical protein
VEERDRLLAPCDPASATDELTPDDLVSLAGALPHSHPQRHVDQLDGLVGAAF